MKPIIKKNFDGSICPPEPFILTPYYRIILCEVELVEDCPKLMAQTILYFEKAIKEGRLTEHKQLTTENIQKIIKHINNQNQNYLICKRNSLIHH
jgi:hypothetical protein